MSWVFLTDYHAYKLKKPVRYSFLDFSTLEARRRDCEEELRLNRRLAGDVYIDTIALAVDAQGSLHLEGNGEPVDWLVKMRRLPGARMMDNAIRRHAITQQEIHQVGEKLALFYQQAAPEDMTPAEYRHRLSRYINENRQELQRPEYGLNPSTIHVITYAQLSLLTDKRWLFDQRIEQGHIIEAHGDLRPDHICLQDPPVIIDCLEFKREFRLLDPADELCFLAVECEWLGTKHIGDEIFNAYSQITGDTPDAHLIAFYKIYRACLRAKIALWHTTDGTVQDHPKWFNKAQDYLRIAEIYTELL